MPTTILITLLAALAAAIPLSIAPAPAPAQHYHLSAHLISSLPASAIAIPNLCVLPFTTTATRYIGTSYACQKRAWTLHNGSLSTAISSKHHDHDHERSFSSLPIDAPRLTSASQFLAMRETPPDRAGAPGGLDVRSAGRDSDGSAGGGSAGGVLEAVNVGGEYENWWLCAIGDGTAGLALAYGFHHGYEGELGARRCERYQLRLTPVVAVERVYAVPVVPKPAVTGEDVDAEGLRRYGVAGRCSSGGFGFACWAQQKVLSVWSA